MPSNALRDGDCSEKRGEDGDNAKADDGGLRPMPHEIFSSQIKEIEVFIQRIIQTSTSWKGKVMFMISYCMVNIFKVSMEF